MGGSNGARPLVGGSNGARLLVGGSNEARPKVGGSNGARPNVVGGLWVGQGSQHSSMRHEDLVYLVFLNGCHKHYYVSHSGGHSLHITGIPKQKNASYLST